MNQLFANNKFLSDFVKMRQNLHEDKKVNINKKHSEPDSDTSSLSIATIIEKKPPSKDVTKFFQKKLSSIGYESN